MEYKYCLPHSQPETMDQYLIPLGTEASLRVPPRTPTGSRSVVSGVWDNVYSRRMMELRRSSRVRQSAKNNAPQYYEPDEKTRMLSTPDVRPRKWQEVEVPAGYFVIKRWVPRDQDHLTPELHGGLTDKPEVGAAGKFTFRSINKFPTRGRNRNKGILTPAARSKGITRSARSAAAAAAAAATTAGGWNAQSYSTPTPQGPPPVPPTAAIPGSYVGDVNSRSRGVVSERAAIKRPAAALTRASETEPPHQVRRGGAPVDVHVRAGGSTTVRVVADSPVIGCKNGASPGPTEQSRDPAKAVGVPGSGGNFGVMWGTGNGNIQQPPWNAM